MPLRIDGTSQSENITRTSTASSRGDMDFTQALGQAQHLQRKELQDFLKTFDLKGKALAQSFSLGDLADFKTMVKSFLRSTFGQSRQLTEETVWDFRGRPKILARIQQIDQSLEDLGKQVIEEHSKPLDLLSKIDEIRGLIIDLLG